jgi:threonine-phosphate decarboxylase
MQQHGGNITAFAEEIGCATSEVIDLSSNINFIKPEINIDFNRLDISPYPNYDKLYDAIAKLYEVKTSQIELFNGATTAIYSLFRELDLEEVTLYAPCYLEYKKSATLYGYQLHFIDRFENMEEEVKENTLVVFVNPSTPDGTFYKIDQLMKQWIEKNCTILIDESFLDFTSFQSAVPYLERYNKLYILKSMTKFYGSAGIRVGALLSTENNIQKIKQREPLWKISEFDSHYLQSALSDESFVAKARNRNDEQRKKLIIILENSAYIEKVYPSLANFVMVKLNNINASTFQKMLTPHKIMVRNCANFDGLDERFVRIAVKGIENLKMLEQCL